MPEEIFEICSHCGVEFNIEWGPGYMLDGRYFCGKDPCRKDIEKKAKAASLVEESAKKKQPEP